MQNLKIIFETMLLNLNLDKSAEEKVKNLKIIISQVIKTAEELEKKSDKLRDEVLKHHPCN